MAKTIKNIIKITSPFVDEAETLWKEKKFDEKKFPEIAEKILKQIPSFELPSLEAITKELINLKLPDQNFPNKDFSDLPITLIRKEKFCLDLYWWSHTDTSIHNHHFTGAFKVIHGSSFQIIYKFNKSKKINKDFETGELLKIKYHELKLNSVFPIELLDTFIHQVFHQSTTTVTICLRSLPTTEKFLSGFLYPNFKIRLKKFEPSFIKHLIGLEILLKTNQKNIPWELDKKEMVSIHYNLINNRLPSSPNLINWLEKELKKDELGKIYLKTLNQQPHYQKKMAEFIEL